MRLAVVLVACCVAHVAADFAIATFNANAGLGGTFSAPLRSANASFLDSYGGYIDGTAPNQYYKSGVYPYGFPNCQGSNGYASLFNITSSPSGVPINITSYSMSNVLATGKFLTTLACFNSTIGSGKLSVFNCSKPDFTYATAGPFPVGKILPPGGSFQFLVTAAGDGYYMQIGQFVVTASLGCTPLSISGGSTSCSTAVNPGTQCTLSCPPGSAPSGPSSVQCVDGAWTPTPATTCAQNATYCGLPAPPGNGSIVTCQQSLYGRCQIACNEGFYQSAAPNGVCTPAGTYNGTIGVCAVNTTYCPVFPPAPLNGVRVSCSGLLGGNCIFACNPGFIISATTQVCSAGHVISGPTITCTENTTYCTVPPVAGNGTLGACDQAVNGTCSTICNTGFVGNNLVRTCQQASGTFSAPASTCTLNTTFCPLPSAPINGSIISCVQSYQGVCTFNCSAGFQASALTRTCSANGQFSGAPVTCQLTSGFCALPAPPNNGLRQTCDTSNGGLCNFACLAGYNISTPVRTCLGNGNFSLPVSNCSLIVNYCPLPSTPPHGSVGVCDRSVNGICNFACDAGYTAQSALTWTCQGDTTWLGPVITCTPTAGYCSQPSTQGLNGVFGTCPGTINSTCDIQCNAGYNNSGADPVCQLGGIYSTIPPCAAITNYCPTLPVVGNSTYGACSQTIGGSCAIVCNDGFYGGGTVQCLQSQDFTPATPCSPKVNFCNQPLAPINGGLGACQTSLSGICQFSCNAGYGFVGANFSVCTVDSSYQPTVACAIVTNWCSAIPPPLHGRISGACSRQIFGTCSATCDDGYQSSTSVNTRTCQPSGQYDGTPVECNVIQNYCAATTPTNGRLGSCNNTINNQCEFLCNAGYSPTVTIRTCQSSTSFTGNDVVCTKTPNYCAALTPPSHGVVDDSACPRTLDSTCTVRCGSGYLPLTNQTTCQIDGTFAFTAFNCTPISCGVLGNTPPTNGAITCSGNSYQDRCRVTCDDGYTLTGNDVFACGASGTWTGAGDASCTVPQDSIITTPPPVATNNPNVPIIIGAAAGAVVLLCLVVIVVLVLRSRPNNRRRRPTSQKGRDSVGAATIRLDTALDGNSDRVNSMLSSKTTSRIGKGAFSAVFKAKMDDGTWVAIKVLENSQDLSAQEFHREVTILGQLGQRNHPNVVHLVFFCPTPPAIVTELCDGGSLYYILQSEKLAEKDRKEIILQIASGMQFLHDCNIVHLDLKPENILRGEGGQMKVTDFGTSLILGIDVQVSMDGLCPAMRFVGTPQYSAPERLQNVAVDLKRCDVFSFGIIMWRMFSDRAPYDGMETDQVIQSYAQRRASINTFMPPTTCPEDFQELQQQCVMLDPRARPYFDEVIDKLGGQKTRRAPSEASMVRPGTRATVARMSDFDTNPSFGDDFNAALASKKKDPEAAPPLPRRSPSSSAASDASSHAAYAAPPEALRTMAPTAPASTLASIESYRGFDTIREN